MATSTPYWMAKYVIGPRTERHIEAFSDLTPLLLVVDNLICLFFENITTHFWIINMFHVWSGLDTKITWLSLGKHCVLD